MDKLIIQRLHEMNLEEGPEPAAALRRLAVCRGGFTLEAAGAILGLEEDPSHLENLIQTLRGWQFVTLQAAFNGHQGRYAIDPLVAAAIGVDESACQAHYDYYEALARRARDAVRDTARAAGGDVEIDAELANLQAAFEWSLGQDVAAAYWLYNACSESFVRRGHAARNLEWVQRIAAAVRTHPDRYLWGAVYNALGVAHQNNPAGSHHDNVTQALAAYRQALEYHTPSDAPLAHAIIQHNLGTAYADLARIEDRADNLRRAVAAYKHALTYRTPQRGAHAYAATHNALGLAYRDLAGVEDRAENLRRALVAYGEALRYYTPQETPHDYAATQNNLGNAYRDLAAVEDRRGNLRRAIDAYREALTYRTPHTAPLAYAATQNNLGTAYRALAEEEDALKNLYRAIAAFEDALRHYTPQRSALDYAAARNNLGSAWFALAQLEDKDDNVRRAVEAFEDALGHYSPARSPLDYAKTQANLGLARRELGDWSGALTCWREAALYFRQMGDIDTLNLVHSWMRRVSGDDAD